MKQCVFFLYFMLFVTFVSCSETHCMKVYYFDAGVEFSASIPTNEFKKHFKRVAIAKAFVPKQEFDSIYYGFTKTSKKKSWEPECRFCLTVSCGDVYINRNSDSFTKDNDSVSVSPRVVYLLRKYCDYYNRIEYEDLEFEHEIKAFGIPDNYKYKQPQFKEHGNKCIKLYRKDK